MPGFKAGKPVTLMGMKSFPFGCLELNDVRVTCNHLLGSEKMGRTIHETITLRTQVAVGALAIGISRAAMEEAVKHSQNRVQFGKPLAHMEATQNKIADMATGIEAARLLVYQAAFFLEQGKQSAQQAAMAKLTRVKTSNSDTVRLYITSPPCVDDQQPFLFTLPMTVGKQRRSYASRGKLPVGAKSIG